MCNTKIIHCRDCGKDVLVSNDSRKILCDDCKTKSQKNHFKHFIVQKIICPECGEVLSTQIKKGTKAKEFIKRAWRCDKCKNKANEKNKFTRKKICKICGKIIKETRLNGTYQLKKDDEYIICVECKNTIQNINKKREKVKKCIEKSHIYMVFDKDIRDLTLDECNEIIKRYDEDNVKRKNINSEESRKRTSLRMKLNNPMKRKEVVEKVLKTREENIKNGILVYKRGSQHHLYKGLGTFNHECRKQLYQCWIKPILERDEFKCKLCGETHNLQVHHILPLRKIIDIVLARHNIYEKTHNFNREKYENFDQLVDEVIKEHKLEYGITVCKRCHEKIDFRYRPYKGVKKS